jgi:hypothetical protein
MFAPLRKRLRGGWEVAAPEDHPLQLLEVTAAEPKDLAFPPAAADATHYLCVHRYDHPGDRAAATFGTSAQLGTPTRWPAADDACALLGKVPVPELNAVVQMLREQYDWDFERQLVTADPPAELPAGCCFAYASCQFPAGMMDRMQANASYGAMAERFAAGPLPTRVLLLGDQVYTDATYGLLDPVRLDDRYRAPYEELTSRDGPLGQLPQDFQRVILATPDDHEIGDDWEPERRPRADRKYPRALAAFWQYQRGEPEQRVDDEEPAGVPVPPRPVWQQQEGRLASASWRLFMTDSRTVRQPRNEDTWKTTLILGEQQTRDLRRWLLDAPAADLKIVTSASMLLPRSRFRFDEPLYLDTWQGYPASLESLLALLCDRQMQNVVFLSGDAHLACDATITVSEPVRGRQCVFHSHHAPPLYAPYPFANEVRQNLILDETFWFTRKDDRGVLRRYCCKVEAKIPSDTRQGFALLHARHDGRAWNLATEVVSSA